MKTATEIFASVRTRIDDPSRGTDAADSRVTNTQLRQFLNEALRRSARNSECLRAVHELDVTGGTQDYTLSGLTNDIIRVHMVDFSFDDSTRVHHLEYRDLSTGESVWGNQRETAQSTPMFFWSWFNPPTLKISFYPTPSADGTADIYYYRLPTEIAENGDDDGDAIDFLAGWDDLIETFVIMRALQKDRRSAEALDEKREYDDGMQALIVASTRHTDAPTQITPRLNTGLVPFTSRY